MMEGQPTASRPSNRQLAKLATGALVVVFIGLLVSQAAPSGPGPSGSLPPGTHGPGASDVPMPSDDAWASVALPPYEPAAELAVDHSDASGIASDARFVLHSLTAAPAVALAAGLSADPPMTFDIAVGANADMATLKPTGLLPPGVRYRLRLTAADGSLAGTWTFRVAGPLHVAGLLPDDQTTDVPVNTGIEVTFDQDGPTDFESHFSISPAVEGRFENHDRTWVFIPLTPLAPATLYTYTVRAGVAMRNSGQLLENDVSASFETEAPAVRESRVVFDRTLFEVRTDTRPILGVYASKPRGEPAPDSLPTELYRLPNLEAAASSAAMLANEREWLESSEAGLVDTTGLTRIATFDARLTDKRYEWYILHVPTVLETGWYLIVVPRAGRDAQAVLQVTDLATYAVSSMTRTVVWLNDLATGTPVAGAAVRRADAGASESLGRTDGDGILDVATPAAFSDESGDGWDSMAHALAIRTTDGRGVVAVLGSRSGGHYPANERGGGFDRQPWWSVLDTDRSLYRTTDTIHAWGIVRDRDDRSVPEQVRLEVGSEDSETWVPVASASVKPHARGTFIADLALDSVPTGSYQLRLYAGRDVVLSQWFEVGVIRKPLFTIDVTTDRHAYLAGDTIAASAAARFFDGTTAPGLDLNVRFRDYDRHTTVLKTLTTDELGVVTTSLPATASSPDGWTSSTVTVVPSHPEEGEIRGHTPIYVFPSSVWLDAHGAVRDGRLHVSGTASRVDLAGVNAQLDRTRWPGDPAGAPLGGQRLQIKVIHIVPVRTQVGTDYDYIEKRTVPRYEYREREDVMGTFDVSSGVDGAFSLSLAVPAPKDTYRAIVTTHDAAGRLSRTEVAAYQRTNLSFGDNALWLEAPDRVSLGESVTVKVRQSDDSTPEGRYLFLLARGGIRDIVLTDQARLVRTFVDADLPGYSVRAVRLTATGVQEVGGAWWGDVAITVEIADKQLHVSLTPDRARYEPGQTVSIAIRTTGPDGQPIAADVVVRATDQKLYAINAADDPDTAAELMRFVGSGLLQSYVAQFAPRPFRDEDGLGAGGGDGGRDDFRDSVTFQLVSTDASGRGTVSFDLSDDLTSWHVAASAFSAGLDAGDGAALVPVGLPFFAEATLAPDYLVGERPTLRVRAYGDGLRTGDPVRFVISSSTLGIEARTVDGRAFEAIRLALPALPAGDHKITIDAERIGKAGLHDRLTRTIHVVPNRLTMLRTTYDELSGTLTPPTGVGLTTYVVTDTGRGGLVPVLQDLAAGGGARFDRLAAAEAARTILATTFDIPLDDLAPTGFAADRYQRTLVGLLPYASSDLSLTAKAALVVPDQIDGSRLLEELRYMKDVGYQDAELSREQAIIVDVARAALGDDVLDELRSAPTDSLSVRERLWLGLGYLASGDETSAREIERDLLSTAGRQFGPWVRLEAGGNSEETTGLMLLLSSGLGDPVSAQISRYLDDHPSSERLFSLEQLGYARSMLDRLPRTAGSFAWTVDGERHVETLEPGKGFSLTLTPAQQQTLSFERLEGQLLVTTSAISGATSADLPSDANVSISRTASPVDGAAEDEMVHVTIRVTVTHPVGRGCYTVTEIVPSGLAPIAAVGTWPDDEDTVSGDTPYLVDGQRVAWCFDPSHPRPLVYSARVVSPGTYTWEPAVVQYDVIPTIGASTPTTSYTIR